MRVFQGALIASLVLNALFLLLLHNRKRAQGDPTSAPAKTAKSTRTPGSAAPLERLQGENRTLHEELARLKTSSEKRTTDLDLIPQGWVGIQARFGRSGDSPLFTSSARFSPKVARKLEITDEERERINVAGRALFTDSVKAAEAATAVHSKGPYGEPYVELQPAPNVFAQFLTDYATMLIDILGEERGYQAAQRVLAYTNPDSWHAERYDVRRIIRYRVVGKWVSLQAHSYTVDGKGRYNITQTWKPEQATSESHMTWRYEHLFDVDRGRRLVEAHLDEQGKGTEVGSRDQSRLRRDSTPPARRK